MSDFAHPPPTPPARAPRAPLHTQASTVDCECGVDEVARGCLFGRVYAAAVVWRPPQLDGTAWPAPVLPQGRKGVVIRDSKTMSRAQRERAAAWIHTHAHAVAVAHRDARYIEAHNIRRAAHDTMADAIAQLQTTVPTLRLALIDGDSFDPSPACGTSVQAPAWPLFRTATPTTTTVPTPVPPATPLHLPAHRCIVRGDNTFFPIACAAIVAKVAHDRYIHALCDADPLLDARYGLRQNVGYGTQTHREGLRVHGPSVHHRRTFAGVVLPSRVASRLDCAARRDTDPT